GVPSEKAGWRGKQNDDKDDQLTDSSLSPPRPLTPRSRRELPHEPPRLPLQYQILPTLHRQEKGCRILKLTPDQQASFIDDPAKPHPNRQASQNHPPPPTIATVNTSLFELFKVGIGPSTSHTVGPMRAALRFTRELAASHLLEKTAKVNVDLYGSLALTGIGHGTDRAILLGLLGEAPDTVDPATVEAKIASIRSTGTLKLGGRIAIPFTE